MNLNEPYRVLNVGSGPRNGGKLHPGFQSGLWREIRLDIDPGVEPDVVSSATDLSAFADRHFDAIWSSHNIEHLHPHEVPRALNEFARVLRPGGFALITCPDLMAVAQALIDHGAETPVYLSPAGPIAPIDMLYGHRTSIAAGNNFMVHHSGFTQEGLAKALIAAGFAEVRLASGKFFDLWALALLDDASLTRASQWLSATEQDILLHNDATPSVI